MFFRYNGYILFSVSYKIIKKQREKKKLIFIQLYFLFCVSIMTACMHFISETSVFLIKISSHTYMYTRMQQQQQPVPYIRTRTCTETLNIYNSEISNRFIDFLPNCNCPGLFISIYHRHNNRNVYSYKTITLHNTKLNILVKNFSQSYNIITVFNS